ncbi:MAG: AzlD domain-containing protein [Chloroflexota bacterium]
MNHWLTIIGMGVITYFIRVSPVLLLERFELSNNLKQALRFVPVAVLTAIIFPEMFQPGGQLDISLGNDRLIAGIIAIAVAYFSQNVIWTVVVGMLALWGLQLI